MGQYNNDLNKINQQLKILLNKKKELTSNIDILQSTLLLIQKDANSFCETMNKCDNIVERKNKLWKSKQFVSKWDEFERNWIDWDYQEIVIWLKKIVLFRFEETSEKEKEKEQEQKEQNNGDNEDSKEKKKDDSKSSINSINNNNNNNNNSRMGKIKERNNILETKIDWNLIEHNLKRRELSGNYLLACTDSELKKLGFNNVKNRFIVLNAIQQLTTKYEKQETPKSPNHNNNSNSNNKKNKMASNKRDSIDDRNVCCICLSNKLNTICIPCGHACMCKGCSKKYNNNDGCPICRKKINNVFDMFIA